MPQASAGQRATSISASRIRTILSQHGYRLTAPREAIVEQALRHDRPFTAEQLVAELREHTDDVEAGIGRATVYRTLEILASVDVLSRVIQPNGNAAYMVDAPGHRHYLVCSGCGTTVSFTSCPVETLVQHLTADTSFAIHDHLLEVFGTCPDCQRDAHADY
ncbi:MAG TPA: Fur family transcriptional regulator [Thermomicrobiales bacterium]|nr:Fur family transcriptional regulator [Thermomicrobiales bacterium]